MIDQRPISSRYLQHEEYKTSIPSGAVEVVNMEQVMEQVPENTILINAVKDRISYLENYISKEKVQRSPYRLVIFQIIIWLFMYSFNRLVLSKLFTGPPKLLYLEIVFVVSFFLIISYLFNAI
jgi:hypothetical protein